MSDLPFMKRNGVRVQMTQEEYDHYMAWLKEVESVPASPATPEQEIAELRAENAEFRRMLEALTRGDTGPEVTA